MRHSVAFKDEVPTMSKEFDDFEPELSHYRRQRITKPVDENDEGYLYED